MGSRTIIFLIVRLNHPSDVAVHFGELMQFESVAMHADAFLGFLAILLPPRASIPALCGIVLLLLFAL